MKRIINSSLFLLMMLLVTVLFAPSMFAAEPTPQDNVDVTLTAAFETGNVVNVPITNVKYGQVISINNFGDLGSYVFDFWIVNGVVREDLAQEATFFATDDMVLVAVFHPADNSEFYTVFVDSNGKIAQQGFINADATVTAPASTGHNKPGYVVSSTPWRSVKGNAFGVTITQASVFELSYTIDSEATFTITKPSEATISNATPLYNEIVTVESTDVDFVAWLENGQVVSYDPIYQFSALRNRTLTVSTEADVAAPVVSLQVLDGTEELRSAYTSYLGQVYLPAGASLIEWGLVGSNSNTMPTYGGANVTLLKSTVIHPLTNEFLRSIPDASDFDYVRAYAVVKVGEAISTVYSYLEEAPAPVQLPAPIHGIGHQPRPIAHIAIGPYSFAEGANGGYTGYGLKFINNTTLETFIWERTHAYNAGFAVNYTEANMLADGIVLTPGNYTLKYYAMGNGVTTSDSNDSAQSINFVIQAPALSKPVLSINGTNLLWSAVSNATSYEVYVDGVLQAGSTSPFDLSLLTEPNTYVLKVVAKANGYQNSEETINYIVENEEAPMLATPSNISRSDFTLTWDAVPNAISYEIRIDSTVKTSTTNSYNLSNFDLSGEKTIYVRAIGNLIDFSNSDESSGYVTIIPTPLPRLNSMVLGDFVSTYILNGVDGGHRKLEIYTGHPVYQQTGWTKYIKIGIKVNGNMIYQNFNFTSTGMQMIHTPGSTTSFFGANLPQSGTIEIHFILVGNGTTNRDSNPLVATMNWSR